MRRYRYMIVLSVLVLALMGCGEEEKQTVPVNSYTPPPPSPTQIADAFFRKTQLKIPLPESSEATFPPELSGRFLGEVRTLVAKNSTSPEGQEAIQIVLTELESKVRESQRKNMWEFIIVYSDAYAILSPESKKYDNVRQKAKVQLVRPKIEVKGFYHDHASDQVAAFVSIYKPLSGEIIEERMRIGEELHDLRFIRVIGKDEGIEVEYLGSGETFQVFKGDDIF